MVKSNTSEGIIEKLVPVLLLASIVLAFVVGMLWQKVNLLQKGGSTQQAAGGNVAGTTNDAPEAPPSGKLTSDQVKKIPPVTDQDHIRGDKNAKVLLIEYSDLQCPYCEQFHPTAKRIVDEYKGQVAWVFRQFPLTQIHPKAMPAAIASECAFNFGGDEAFWKFVDAIYADQEGSLDKLAEVAVKIGLDKNKFQTCLDNEETKSKVDDQLQKGLAAGITGTPGNFVVNQKGDAWLIPGALPFDNFKTTLDEALK